MIVRAASFILILYALGFILFTVTLGRPVALKLIAPELAQDERFRARFLRESRLAASLDHPNIIPIFEAGEADGQLFIAMRYVIGSDLKGVLAELGGQLPLERTLRLFSQIGSALDSAHRAGLPAAGYFPNANRSARRCGSPGGRPFQTTSIQWRAAGASRQSLFRPFNRLCNNRPHGQENTRL